ncbi:MAG: hypothetical protein CM1200mP30_16590 [Pseudomonadota bacterium]|nr:MAG: hypothetical protein CM1200mP30_16590 [Pseudomonadota bacterium]
MEYHMLLVLGDAPLSDKVGALSTLSALKMLEEDAPPAIFSGFQATFASFC